MRFMNKKINIIYDQNECLLLLILLCLLQAH